MTRRRIIIFSFTILVAAVAVIYLCIPKEPRCHGRSYSAWLAIAKFYDQFPAPPGKNDEWWDAVNAINEIGTNAAPHLAGQLVSPQSSKLKASIVSWLNRHAPARYHIRSDAERLELARFGVWLLKDKKAALWPYFVDATRSSNPERRERGLFWLEHTGADKEIILPVLLRLANDSDPEVRESAVITCCTKYPNDASAAGLPAILTRILESVEKPRDRSDLK